MIWGGGGGGGGGQANRQAGREWGRGGGGRIREEGTQACEEERNKFGIRIHFGGGLKEAISSLSCTVLSSGT